MRLSVIDRQQAVDPVSGRDAGRSPRRGVVVGTADPAHAGLDAGGLEPGDVIAAGMLHPAVGVMHRAAGDHVPMVQRHLQCLQRQAGLRVIGSARPTTLRLKASSSTAR